jgi:regulator of RNase E activity RraB
MTDTLTVAEKLKEVGFSEAQAAALTRAIEAAATAKAELVEAQMNKDLAALIERSDAKFEASNARFEASNAKLEASIEKTARDQTRWFATIVFSAIGLLIAAYGIVSHFK